MTITRVPPPVAVMLNPYSGYAEWLAHRLWGQHGVRVVALHSDWRTRLVGQGWAPFLGTSIVAAEYMVPPDGVAALAPHLGRAHHVVGVIPHDEGAVGPLSLLAELLGLSWAQPDVLPAFRDKAALKARVARTDPGIRLNAVRLVDSAEDVRRFAAEQELSRVVLKPNDGSGNRHVRFLDDADLRSPRVEEYLAAERSPVLAEEYVAGEEFWVNGQVDRDGAPTVYGIGRYHRAAVNDLPNLELGCRSLASTDPAFGLLRDYAERVIRATGLRRSPFHLEAKIDDRGPCLIEVAARLCGDQACLAEGWQHGPAADPVGAALYGYLVDDTAAPLRLDWNRYDAHPVARVNGYSAVRQQVARVAGAREVESMPGFLWWVKRPRPGNIVLRTHDLVSKPWCLVFHADNQQELDEKEQFVRSTLRLVGDDSPLAPRDRLALAAGRAGKYWSARPRTGQVRSLLRR